MLDGLAVLHAELLHDAPDPVGGEPPHQVVLQRQVEAARPGVALTPGTTAELVVDAPRLVTLGAYDVESAGGDHRVMALAPRRPRRLQLRLVRIALRKLLQFRDEIASEHDVGPAAGHVGRDGHGAGTPGLRDDGGLPRMLLRVQHLVRDCRVPELSREQLGGLDRSRSDQDRLAPRLAVADVLQHRVELLLLREEHQIGHVVADHVEVGRDNDDFESVDLLELRRLGVRRARHSRELVVEPEVVLERDGRECLVLTLDRHPFLGLDRLVQALRPAPTRHRAAGELVDDHDLPVTDDVLDVAVKQRVRAKRGVQMVHQNDVRRVVEALAFGKDACFAEDCLDLLVAVLGQVDLPRFLVDGVVAGAVLLDLALESGNDLVDTDIQLGGLVRRTRDDERGAGFVDEDGVHFIDDCESEFALHLVGIAERHVVAQVVEAELVVRRVDDIRRVGVALVPRMHARHHDARAHAQKLVDRTHPLRVAPREVVVDGHDVHGTAGQSIQVGGQGGHQRLALSGAHLGDPASMEGDAAEELDVEMAHFEHAAARLAHHRECLGQHVFERLPLPNPAAERVGPRAQFRVGERGEPRLQCIDALDGSVHPP